MKRTSGYGNDEGEKAECIGTVEKIQRTGGGITEEGTGKETGA